ncbi:Calmodulin-3, partial [Gonapodya sp. JEL0774]
MANSQHQLDELREIFSLVDADGGGTISKEAEIDALVHEIDSQNTGEIDFSSFVDAMSRKLVLPHTSTEINRAFNLFSDSGGPSTTVTRQALVQALVLHGDKDKRMSVEDADDLIAS